MKQLTFKGYLSNYVRYLSGLNTNNIKKLAQEAQKNHRLREPLLMYAYSSGKVDLLLEVTEGSELGKDYQKVSSLHDLQGFHQALATNSETLDDGYKKCYKSYVSKRDMPNTHDETKHLMSRKINSIRKAKGLSVYKLYKDLNLDGSNINAFLNHEDTKRVSLDVARRILQYVENV